MPSRAVASPTAADATREYVDEHPSIRLALSEELLNYTALAQKIQAERGVPNEEAVTIACRRYERVLTAPNPELERVRSVLRRSRLEVHSRVASIRIRNDWEALDALLALGRTSGEPRPARRLFQVYEGTQAITILVEDNALPELLAGLPRSIVTRVDRGLTTLIFRGRVDAVVTPGVLAFMAEALFQNGVNCVETVSVHHDTILVFRDADVIRAYQVLSALVPVETPLKMPRRPSEGRGSKRRA